MLGIVPQFITIHLLLYKKITTYIVRDIVKMGDWLEMGCLSYCLWNVFKIEPPITNNLNNYNMMWSIVEQSKYFQRCIDQNDGDCKKNCNFITWIEISMNFGRQNALQTHGQCLDSSNFDHSRTNFLLTTSYFLSHYFGAYVMN